MWVSQLRKKSATSFDILENAFFPEPTNIAIYNIANDKTNRTVVYRTYSQLFLYYIVAAWLSQLLHRHQLVYPEKKKFPGPDDKHPKFFNLSVILSKRKKERKTITFFFAERIVNVIDD